MSYWWASFPGMHVYTCLLDCCLTVAWVNKPFNTIYGDIWIGACVLVYRDIRCKYKNIYLNWSSDFPTIRFTYIRLLVLKINGQINEVQWVQCSKQWCLSSYQPDCSKLRFWKPIVLFGRRHWCIGYFSHYITPIQNLVILWSAKIMAQQNLYMCIHFFKVYSDQNVPGININHV